MWITAMQKKEDSIARLNLFYVAEIFNESYINLVTN